MSSASSPFDRISATPAAAGKVAPREGLYSTEAAPSTEPQEELPDATAAAAEAAAPDEVSVPTFGPAVRVGARVVGVTVAAGLVVAAAAAAARRTS